MSFKSICKTLAPLLACGVVVGCNGAFPDSQRVIPASIITVRLPGTLRRPAVEFPHGKHSAALQKEGCATCHPRDARGRLSPWMGRSKPGQDRDTLTALYHGKCISCHKQKSGKDKKLPLACGECHDPRRGKGKSARKLIAFDASLHFRHTLATGQKQCKTCHHLHDKQQKALVYKKGAEGRCGDCHGKQAKGNTPSLRHASHTSCITCHQVRKGKGQQTGPVTCAGCHDGGRPAAIKKVQVTERLDIGQKDLVQMRTAGSKTAAVVFDHKLHEQSGTFCTTCHHQTVKTCGSCHTRTARKQGGGVSLEQAHHMPGSGRSCVGCHDKMVRNKDCAGCHQAIGRAAFERSCTVCHRGSAPPRTERRDPREINGSRLLSTLAALPAPSEDFPEKVEIKVLASKYQPSMLPHKKIVEKLHSITQKSKLARSFHGKTEALCAGCHHHSPVGQRPPACSSCHGDSGHKTLDRPSLKVAYHRQCMGCHQKMGIKEQGCTDCHARAGGKVNK